MTMFPLVRVLADTLPVDAPTGVVFNAPRPLCGDEFGCDLRGFTVVVAPDRYRRAEAVEGNRRLDARVVEWVTRGEALAEARAYVVAGYGKDVADEAGEDTLLDVWAQRFRLGTVEV